MNKIYNIILGFVLIGLASSCTGFVDDIFDKSSAERAASVIDEQKAILMSPENGWILTMKADPGDQIGFGAYNMFIKFAKNDSVEVSSELGASNKVISSHYRLYQSQGINLSFDEYNEFIHFFSDPKNPNNIGSTGQGLKGDFEFLILKATKEEVLLKGKKNGIVLSMVPADNNFAWKDQIDKINDVDNNMGCYNSYKLSIKGQKDSIDIYRTYRSLSYVDETGNEIIIPYTINEDGLMFLKPVNINGHVISGFKNNKDGISFTSIEDNDVVLNPVIKPILETFNDYDWFFSKSKLSPTLQKRFDICLLVSEYLEESLLYMRMFVKSNDIVNFNFISGKYVSNIEFQYSIIDKETVNLELIVPANNTNAGYYYSNGYYYLFDVLSGNYKVTADNYKAPSMLTFTNESNPDLYFTVSSSAITMPGDN